MNELKIPPGNFRIIEKQINGVYQYELYDGLEYKATYRNYDEAYDHAYDAYSNIDKHGYDYYKVFPKAIDKEVNTDTFAYLVLIPIVIGLGYLAISRILPDLIAVWNALFN